MAIDENQVQQAVYNLLIAANMCGRRIYDQPPQDVVSVTYPMIEIGATVATELDDSTGLGIEWVLTLDIWSEQPGKKEVQSLRKAVRDALHHQAFTTGDGTDCLCWIEGGTTVPDPEGVGWHGIVRLRVEARN